MADQPTTPSGSRWEPDPDDTTPAGEAIEAAPEPYGAVAPPLDDPAAEERRAQLRGRAILAGAATALTLGGGLTGFVIGHSTAGNDTFGFQPATNSFHRDGSGQQPGGYGQQLGEGQQGPPSFLDGDGDGDGGGFGGPPGSDGSDGSTSGGTTSNSATGT